MTAYTLHLNTHTIQQHHTTVQLVLIQLCNLDAGTLQTFSRPTRHCWQLERAKKENLCMGTAHSTTKQAGSYFLNPTTCS